MTIPVVQHPSPIAPGDALAGVLLGLPSHPLRLRGGEGFDLPKEVAACQLLRYSLGK